MPFRDNDPANFLPRHCVWEVTLACNLRCGHCGSSAGRPRTNEMTTRQCVDVVHQLADLECRLITLSGGEPTLRPDWEDIARTAVARNVTVNMVTNGTTMTGDLARRIKDCGMSNAGISLDGTEKQHDAIRGRGNFRKVARAMETLARASLKTSVLTHLNRHTVTELDAIHDLSVAMGASAFRVQLGKPMGNLARRRELTISPQDLLDVIPRIARIKRRSPIWVYVGDSMGYYGPYEKEIRESRWGNMRPLWSGCQAGKRSIGIESDGGVKGCLSLQADLHGCNGRCGNHFFREGSLQKKRLEDIWFHPDAFAFNRKKRVQDLTGYCRRCRYRKLCMGGASCVAAAFTGRLGEDPYCYHRVLDERSRSYRFVKSMRNRAAAAMLSLGVGLSAGSLAGACLSGCDDRAVGAMDNQNTPAMQDASMDPDAEPPYVDEYGIFPELDASIGDDAEPPNFDEYGVFPEFDASVEDDAEPPNMDDYGDIPPP